MKYFFAFIICAVILGGCSVNYSQLYETKSTFNEDGNTEFENDTVKISYYFWSESGVLAFSIYNKLNVPIYVDWKKSSYIRNEDKYDYWIDEQNTESNSSYASVTYKGFLTGWGTVGTSTTTSKAVKPERITFIAPHSKYKKYTFSLYNPKGTLIDTSVNLEFVPSKRDPKKVVGIYNRNYVYSDANTIFRNFLTLSTSEKFDKEIYVDNTFYVSKITEMPVDELLGPYTVNGNNIIYSLPYKENNRFYIKIIDEMTTLSYRKKHHKK
jgi:hypothetical protein